MHFDLFIDVHLCSKILLYVLDPLTQVDSLKQAF